MSRRETTPPDDAAQNGSIAGDPEPTDEANPELYLRRRPVAGEPGPADEANAALRLFVRRPGRGRAPVATELDRPAAGKLAPVA